MMDDTTGTAQFGETELRVEETLRKGLRTDEERLTFTRSKPVAFQSLTGDGVTEQPLETKLGSIPAKHGYALLHALADYYNCEVTER